MTLTTTPRTASRKRSLIEVGQTLGPRNARTDPGTGLRYYRWQGRDLPSVTTIRRLAGIPHGLHQWALGQVVDYALDNAQEIASRLTDPAQLPLVRHELRAAATAERDAKAALGSAIHQAIEAGKAVTDVGPDIAPRLRRYYEWAETTGVEILGQEIQIWNLTVGYAGSVDILARFPDGSIWVIDTKTGKGVYAEHLLQLLPYLMGEFVGADDTVDPELTALLHQASGVALLHLEDGQPWEFRSLHATPEAWAAFRGLLAFGTWMADHPTVDTVTLGLRRGAA